jgi:hypothetical protein
VGQERLGLLREGEGTGCEIPYGYEGLAVTRLPADGRTVALHGLGRLVAYRPNPEREGEPYFEAWGYRDLFVHLAATANPGGKAEPKPRRIERRLSQYFTVVGWAVALLLGGGAWWLSGRPQMAGRVAAGRGLWWRRREGARGRRCLRRRCLRGSPGGRRRGRLWRGAGYRGERRRWLTTRGGGRSCWGGRWGRGTGFTRRWRSRVSRT